MNVTIIQPSTNYNLPRGWHLVTAPIITADWKAPSEDCRVVPVGVCKIVHLGRLPLNMHLSAF